MRMHVMKSIMKAVPIAIAVAINGVLAINSAFGKDQVKATNIPAAMCHPEPSAVGRIELSGASWRFKGDQIGTAKLFCPVPLSDKDKDNETNWIWSFAPHYMDNDARGTAVSVTVRLVGVNSNTRRTWYSDLFSSNNYDTPRSLTSVDFLVWYPHIMQPDTMYYFEVTMTRTSLAKYRRWWGGFYGISFPQTYHPLGG